MDLIIKKILRKENIAHDKITKATSGFTNLVFFVDDNFVIKLSNDNANIKKLEKEISIYKNVSAEYIPTFISDGTFEGYKYLIISKIKGKSLYSIWHTLTPQDRQSCVQQLAQILKDFNSQSYSFLLAEYKDTNWQEYMKNELLTRAAHLKSLSFDVTKIVDFVSSEANSIFAHNTLGLVYNDAHFDNFIYNDVKLSLIDFDRVKACPIDYEMLIFKTMCDNPSKFASEEDEKFIKNEDYLDVYEQFKTEYPQMFDHQYIETRIKIYQFNYLMKHAIKCRDKDWINKLLKSFLN